MSSFKFNKLSFLVTGAALLALAAAQGCSSSGDDTQASPGGSTGTAGKSGAGNGDSGAGNTTSEGGSGNTGNTSGEAGGGGVGNDAGSGGEAGRTACTGPNGCYSCAPTNSTQFENGCVTGGCPDTFTDRLPKIALVPKFP